MTMRSFPSRWLSSESPNLASTPSGNTTEDPVSTSEALEARHMSESFTSFDLPLASDPALRERYINTTGGIRELRATMYGMLLTIGMGKLLEREPKFGFEGERA